jgi:hypothetical protein
VKAAYSKGHVPAWDEGLLYFCDSQMNQIKSVQLIFMTQTLPKFNPVSQSVVQVPHKQKHNQKHSKYPFTCCGMKSLYFCICVKCLTALY